MADESKRKMLFVRNLPYNLSAGEFEEKFSEYGPIVQSFLVKDGSGDGENRCRGFGYVKFAIQEDADKAVAGNNLFSGRKSSVCYSSKKPRHKSKVKPDSEAETKEEELASASEVGKKKAAKGTVEVDGGTPDEKKAAKGTVEVDGGTPDKKQKKAAKRKVEVDGDTPDEKKAAKGTVEVDEGTPSEKKQKKTGKGTVKVDGGTPDKMKAAKGIGKKPEIKAAKEDIGVDAASKLDSKRTVVLIGLMRSTNKKKIKKLCMRFGTMEKLSFPVEVDGVVQAHVRYQSYKDAVRAFQKCRGKALSGCVLDACLLSAISRHRMKTDVNAARIILRNLPFKLTDVELKALGSKYGEVKSVSLPEKLIDGQPKLKGFGFIQFASSESAQKALDGLNMASLQGRSIIVDWAVAKDKYNSMATKENIPDGDAAQLDSDTKKTSRRKEVHTNSVEAESDEEYSDGDDALEEDAGDDEDSDALSDADDDSHNADDSDGAESADDDNTPVKPRPAMKDAKEGRTVFLSNLLYETEEDDIVDELESFGEIEYCKIVYDREKEHSRGCCFVKFQTMLAAEACLSAVNSTDPSGGVLIDGRRLNGKLAVTKGKLQEMQKQGDNSKEKDKRNLYLANEGVILPNSHEAKDCPPQDLMKRKKAWMDKKVKLKNPNFFVSRTRLCMRNLPLTVDDNGLKSAIRQCVGNSSLAIVQAKILRSKDRVDPTGALRSLGYGFVEFDEHEDALHVLRTVNNNATAFGDKRRPIVEFSVENSVALKLRSDRQARGKKKTENRPRIVRETTDEPAKPRVNKSQARRQRFKAKVMETKQSGNVWKPKEHERQATPSQAQPSEKTATNISNTNSDKNTNLSVGRKGKEAKRTLPQADDTVATTTHARLAKRPKVIVNQDEAAFNNLVNSYKAKLFGAKSDTMERSASKWYE